MIYVLDTFALLAFFWREPGYAKVRAALKQALGGQTTVYMSRINFGEAFYMTWKKRDQSSAERVLRATNMLPIILEPAIDARIMEAARLKAQYPISYADSFAATLAIELGATLLTNDPEFKAIQHLITIEWLT